MKTIKVSVSKARYRATNAYGPVRRPRQKPKKK